MDRSSDSWVLSPANARFSNEPVFEDDSGVTPESRYSDFRYQSEGQSDQARFSDFQYVQENAEDSFSNRPSLYEDEKDRARISDLPREQAPQRSIVAFADFHTDTTAEQFAQLREPAAPGQRPPNPNPRSRDTPVNIFKGPGNYQLFISICASLVQACSTAHANIELVQLELNVDEYASNSELASKLFRLSNICRSACERSKALHLHITSEILPSIKQLTEVPALFWLLIKRFFETYYNLVDMVRKEQTILEALPNIKSTLKPVQKDITIAAKRIRESPWEKEAN